MAIIGDAVGQGGLAIDARIATVAPNSGEFATIEFAPVHASIGRGIEGSE
jgi:hypothetical protein